MGFFCAVTPISNLFLLCLDSRIIKQYFIDKGFILQTNNKGGVPCR
jgi:hypothetical protein